MLTYVCFIIDYTSNIPEILLLLKDSKYSDVWQSKKNGSKKVRNGREILKKKFSTGLYETSEGQAFQGLGITCSRRLENTFFCVTLPNSFTYQ